ncbi:MAG: glycogen synthase GlgA [Candidatus Zixiibacteriota bacterium]
MDKLRILMAASEAGPYARTGGLGDVMGALPAALGALGHEVKVVMPRYSSISNLTYRLTPVLDAVEVADTDGPANVTVERAGKSPRGVEFLFVGYNDYFGRTGMYVDPKTGKDYEDNDLRFAFFARAVIEVARGLEWRPDIIHVHDWQAALVPAYLKTKFGRDSVIGGCATILTIHNLGYQGLFDGDRFAALDLPAEMFYAVTGALEFYGKVNFLKCGIRMADKITTVSPRYAREIQSSDEFGCGLEGVLADRAADLFGIINGVDYSIWSPKTDSLVPHRYGLSNLTGKRMNKVELLNQAGLPVRERTPLIGMVTRLTAQKGIDLLISAAGDIFSSDYQMIILGAGDAEYQSALKRLESRYPDKLKVFLEFNDTLAHLIQAAADMFLMPSRYEPCGLNQMYALRYGTVPVVRAVGGLVDTVVDYDPVSGNGTGFQFDDFTVPALMEALGRARALFQRRQAWSKLIKTGMRVDYSWSASAHRYEALYRSLAPGPQ